MESTILLDSIFKDILEKIDPKFLEQSLKTEYESFRAINTYTLDAYYKIFSRKPNKLLLMSKLLNSFDLVIDNSLRILKRDNYPKDRILLIYAYLTYYVILNSNYDLEALENSLIKLKNINKKDLVKSYTKGYFKLDLVSLEFFDELIRTIIMYPGGIDYINNSSYHKFYLLSFFKGSSSKFKAFLLKCFNKLFNKSFKSNPNLSLDNASDIYNDLKAEALNLINAFNNYLYFNKSKEFNALKEKYNGKQ